MESLEKEFIAYEEALTLKELGFDEPCLCSWNFYTNERNFNPYPSIFHSEDVIQLPTYSQAFRWFREKMNIPSYIELFNNGWDYVIYLPMHQATQYDDGPVETYEEAELACLKRLIKIVQGGNK